MKSGDIVYLDGINIVKIININLKFAQIINEDLSCWTVRVSRLSAEKGSDDRRE